MLVLTRRTGESLRIGTEVRVVVLSSSGNQVRLGVEAPSPVPVHREEVYRRIAEANQEAVTVAIEHRRFGRLEIPESDVLEFDGLPGFPSARRFALLAHDRDEVFAWLVSLDDPDLALVVTDPGPFFPDYRPGFATDRLAGLGAASRDEVEVLVVVNLRRGEPTLNLLAPVALCARTRRGAQWILEDGGLSPCEPMPAGWGAPGIESKPDE